MPDVKCPKCGKESLAGIGHCPACGADLPGAVAAEAPRPSAVSMYGLDMAGSNPIHWGAAGLGVGLILVAQILFGLTLVPLMARGFLLQRNPNVFLFTVFVLGIGLAIYFFVGYFLGRYSKAYLVREAAIAAAGAAAVNFVLSRYVLHEATSLLMSIIGAILYASLGWAGGALGEQLQQKAREQRQRAAELAARQAAPK